MFVAYKAVLKDKDGIYTNGMDNAPKHYWKKNKHYTIEGNLTLCKKGFHYFRHLCFAINYLEKDNEIWKVEIHGDTIEDTFKGCTNDIVFINKVSNTEIKQCTKRKNNSGNCNSGNHNSGDHNSGDHNSGNCNSGNFNSGRCNSGNHNSGNYNSGRYNSGHCNSGRCNSGRYNSGNCNSGNFNSGHCNSGHCNSGHHNSGHHNSGHCNSGHCNSGNGYINYFCTETKYFLFDIEVKEIPDKIKGIDMCWFNLKDKTYHEAWKCCPKEILDIFRSISEFKTKEAKDKFKVITGLDL